VIESIGNELAIAVHNSLSVEEIRELNESLKHRVDEATREIRQSNRRLQQLDKVKDEFISMASHQLRTPLTSIKGYLDTVLQGDLGHVNSTQRVMLSEAFISSERMVTLINDFLNVSRLQIGKFVIERRDGDLKEVVRDQIDMLRNLTEQHRLQIKEHIDDNVPTAYIDIEKLRQVILNFIDNAIYYSKPDAPIYVSLTKENNHIVFTVKDSGIGVPESEKSQQRSSTSSRRHGRRVIPSEKGRHPARRPNDL
jgi:signal transduction histidine kinase